MRKFKEVPIPIVGEVRKKKVLLYGDDLKVLCFESDGLEPRIFVPTIQNEESETMYGLNFEEQMKQIIDFSNLVPIDENLEYVMRYQVHNGKAKKVCYKKIREYFSCYQNLNRNDIAMIMDIAYLNGLQPNMLTFKDIQTSSFLTDNGLANAVHKLEQKVYYHKY